MSQTIELYFFIFVGHTIYDKLSWFIIIFVQKRKLSIQREEVDSNQCELIGKKICRRHLSGALQARRHVAGATSLPEKVATLVAHFASV